MLDPSIAVALLIDTKHPALWDYFSQRETLRFLRLGGSRIQIGALDQLCKEILKGPPREKYRDDISGAEWENRREHSIWLRLAKLRQSGAKLSPDAERAFAEIDKRHSWKLADDFSDEFPFFTGSGFAVPDETPLDFANMGAKRFKEWATNEEERTWDNNGWEGYCDQHPQDALDKLNLLAEKGIWPNEIWRITLWSLSRNKGLQDEDISRCLELVLKMPLASLNAIHTTCARWLQSMRGSISAKRFFELWQSIWDSTKGDLADDQPSLTNALNHSGGILAEILLDTISHQYPIAKVGEIYGIPAELQPYFNSISEGTTYTAKLARIRLAANMLYLFRIDPQWTRDALIRRMRPSNPDFESSIWEGYLWIPRISDDLLEEITPSFVTVLHNLECIPSDSHKNAVELFVVAAIPPSQNLTPQLAKAVLQDVGIKGLAQAAWMLNRMLRDAEEKSLSYWHEVIQPWFDEAWPTQSQFKVSEVSSQLARMAIDSGEAFPEVIRQIEGLLSREEHPSATIYALKRSGLHKLYPEEARTLLNKVVGKADILGSHYDTVLSEISEALQSKTE